MKKVLALILCCAMALCLMACGGTSESASTETTAAASGEKNEIGQLVDEGYEENMSTWDNGKWIGVYSKDGSYLRVTADFPSSAEDAYNALDMMSDDYFDQVAALVYSLSNVQTEDITDQVPTQEELDVYVGKTFGDLEDDGYENTGWYGDEETGVYTFIYDGDAYTLNVGMQEGETIADMDDYSANDIRALVIGSVSFNGFSSNFLYK